MVTIRQRLAALVGAVTLLSLITGAGTASAQTTTTPPTYTPGTSVPGACTAGATNAGTVSIGQSFVIRLCGAYKPGSAVNGSVDGQSVGTKTAAADGSIAVAITITSATVAAVTDATNVNITCGSNINTVTGTGPGFTSGTATQTGTFTVLCAATSPGGIAFTGTNVLKGVLAALVLIAIGGALVLAQRRRHSHQV